jgi:hypothetical protein
MRKAVTFGLQMRIREEFRPEEERTPGLLQELVAKMEVIACTRCSGCSSRALHAQQRRISCAVFWFISWKSFRTISCCFSAFLAAHACACLSQAYKATAGGEQFPIPADAVESNCPLQ